MPSLDRKSYSKLLLLFFKEQKQTSNVNESLIDWKIKTHYRDATACAYACSSQHNDVAGSGYGLDHVIIRCNMRELISLFSNFFITV
jgi:hypothetical protein